METTTMTIPNEQQEQTEKKRYREILRVFARHGFYVNGLTPYELRTTLEDLGPTYVKFGQILSSRNDMLPAVYCKELEKLRSSVAPLEADVVRSIIERETGKPIDETFAEFRDEPLGSASIAQAHLGVLLDGTKVVTKVQRPGIDDMCARDFALLKRLAGIVGVASEESNGSLDLVAVIGELEQVTTEELDFTVEAENTREFRERCIREDEGVSCPRIIDELTTTHILTMTCVDGYSIEERDRIDEDGYDRKEICRTLASNYLHQVMDVGLFHGDPHQGNIMVSKGVPYWIDFGMVGRVSEASILVLQEMMLAIAQKDADGLADAALTLSGGSRDLDRTRFVEDMDFFINKYTGITDISSIDMGVMLTEMADLMDTYKLPMPSEYTMLARSLVTFEGTIEALCPEFDLFGMLTEKMTERIKESTLSFSNLNDIVEEVAATGMSAARTAGYASESLRNLAKGRTKVGIELTNYAGIADSLRMTVTNLVFAMFACVIFGGSCVLCTTNVQPQAGGVPLVAMIGFIFSVALGIYATKGLLKGK